MKTMTLDEFKESLKSQGVKSHEQFAFKCPMCGTIQSAQDLIAAGAGKTFDDVEKYLAFSCVGRWTEAGPNYGKNQSPAIIGCNWTLGGLLRLHKLEVITPDGEHHPRFEPVSPAEAQEHAVAVS